MKVPQLTKGQTYVLGAQAAIGMLMFVTAAIFTIFG